MLRAIFLSLLLSFTAHSARADDVTIFAASSLKTALDEALAGMGARVSYGGSGALARQISQGAPADIFISANPLWMDAIAENLTQRADLLTNKLVIVSRNFATLESEGRVAMGLLASVPAGLYGQAYLAREGLWDDIAPRVIEVDSARAALALAAKGEVAYAVVYITDAIAEPRVQVVKTFASDPDLPILYPIALIADTAAARDLYTHLQSPEARAIFAKHGFGAP